MGEAGTVIVSTRELVLLVVSAGAAGAMFGLLPLGLVMVLGVKEWR